jgi:Zn finger protein HypA/HybF involved in hydrogenase expression
LSRRHDSILQRAKSLVAAEKKYLDYIEKWKSGLETGMRGKTSISAHIRKYLFIKYENKCSSCGWNSVNLFTGRIPLEIDHIDGNHTNNSEENLRLLCPNCHALTPTFRSLNKGNGRPRN